MDFVVPMFYSTLETLAWSQGFETIDLGRSFTLKITDVYLTSQP